MPALVNVNLDAEEAKLKGNRLFAAKDYEGSIECFTEAITLDKSQWTYPLNRCFAYLKLQRWAEAETDATAALELDDSNPKALYRRSLARKALGKFSSAYNDIWSYGSCRGDWKTVVDENAKISAAEAAAVAPRMNSPSQGFKIVRIDDDIDDGINDDLSADIEDDSYGAFATRQFSRGDLILIEKPLYTVTEQASPVEIAVAVRRLPLDGRVHLAQLANAFSYVFDNPWAGIHKTNSFAAGDNESILCLLASRFNHSCSPNARYSWHAPSQTFRIYALREITPDEELLVSYISARHVYGSTAAERRARLKGMLGFTCTCATCTLPAGARAASDARRVELAQLWEAGPFFPPNRTHARLQSVRRALELMRAEGYHADADDFANEAAAVCAFHSDWASVLAWATCTYRARVAEFGGDSLRATVGAVVQLLVEPRKYRTAGMGTKQVFSVRPP